MLDKDKLKQSLTIEQVSELVAELGGEPRPIQNDIFISKTICHNPIGQGSYKLYYYGNTQLFKCYTDCPEDSFDIYQLVQKVKSRAEKTDWSLPKAINYVAIYFGFSTQFFDFGKEQEKLKDWEILNKYERNQIAQQQQKQIVDPNFYDASILKYLPRPRILDWEREGISAEIMTKRGIAFDPSSEGVVIPHYNIDGQLIGIRERTLIKELEAYGKYRPAFLNNKLYNHALGFNLYNLNYSKNNIATMQKALVLEGKKQSRPSLFFLAATRGIT